MDNAKEAKHTLGDMLKSIRFSFGVYWHGQKIIVISCIMAIVLRVALPYVGIYMPKLVLDLLQNNASQSEFITQVGIVSLLIVALSYLKSFSDSMVNESVGTVGILKILGFVQEKRMSADFELLESPEFQKRHSKVNKAIHSNHSLSMNIARTTVQFSSNVIGLVLYSSVIISIHPIILLLLLASSAVNWWALSRSRKYNQRTLEERSTLDRKFNAVSSIMRDPEAAKDIRLFSAYQWLHGLVTSLLQQRTASEKKVLTKQMQAQLIDGFMILLRDGVAYGYLIYLLLADQLSLGDFVFVFAAIGAMGGWISGLLVAASDLSKSSVELSSVQEYLSQPDRMNTGKGLPLPTGERLPPTLELKNVGYSYPNSEKPTLCNINVSIRKGERIALVGANGAGKTTLVKLICGLYMPSQGEVCLNGNKVSEYNRDEYYTLFSTVFQDIHLLSCDISGNISQQPPELTDDAKISRCLELSGLKSKTDVLPDKEKTLLIKSVNSEAIELSGGEKQKLALARALYKNAPVIILDEPTAALDPIAENEIYNKYAELTEGTTSVYISHRLASTRFCDRILLLNGSTITEEGTHDELMRLGGVYANMFEVQASYYQEEKVGVGVEE